METIKDVVLEYFPKATDEDVEFILWEKTGYPTFWRKEHGNTPEQCLRTQLKRFKAEVEYKEGKQ